MTFDLGKGWGTRKPLRPVSKKRAKVNAERSRVVHERWGRNPRCEGCTPLALLGITSATTGCDGWATDAHEIVSRARGGSITDTDNILPLGRSCHRFVTENPEIAEAAGLSRSRHTGET
jgi:hypothetical protein